MGDKKFYIPQISEEDEQEALKKSSHAKAGKSDSGTFISSIYGTNVKNEVFYYHPKFDDVSRRYDSFRNKPKHQDINEFKDYIISKGKETYRNMQDTEDDERNFASLEESYPQEDLSPLLVDITSDDLDDARDEPVSYDLKEESKPSLKTKKKRKVRYVAPPLSILRSKPKDHVEDLREIYQQRDIIDMTLAEFGIGGKVVNFTNGPTVTRFEVQLDTGVNFKKIAPIQSNMQANLKAISLRLQCPIPGKSTLGIEVPNVTRDDVYFGDLISARDFLNDGNPMNVVLGTDVDGDAVYLNIADMPHGLIAGSTGSGKSVCLNTIIASILFKAHPDDVKLILIDPKRVEFSPFKGIPHLATPIITDTKMANAALKWVIDEMEARYVLFEKPGVQKYQEYIKCEAEDPTLKHIPYIVIIIDELSDLLLSGGPDVEEKILKISQKARAAGIHMIVSTQRPSVDIISGSIKNNFPTKIAFRVAKAIDSNIIIDRSGAEKLLGRGDMLYITEGGFEYRIQGAYISNEEIKEAVASLSDYPQDEYLFTEQELKNQIVVEKTTDATEDDLFFDIARYVVANNIASINLLQKKFGCGFSRMQAIIMKLGELGVVSENLGSKAREVLMDSGQLEEVLAKLQ